VRGWVKRVERDLRAIEILKTLVTVSLTEDALGAVQRDIPKVLEAFCTFLTVVEDAREELVNALKPDDPPQRREDTVRALEPLNELQFALTDALQSIVGTFKEKLTVYKFAPKTARRVQIIVDQL